MMKNGLVKKGLVAIIIILFVGASVVPGISGNIGIIRDISEIDKIENTGEQSALLDDPPETEWMKTFGGSWSDEGYSVSQTSDGGYIIAGLTCSYGAGEEDVWLIKTDSNGNKQWDKTFGGTNWDMGLSVSQTTDGGYIIGGCTMSYGAGDLDVWLIKTDANGNKQWDKTFGGTNWDMGYSVSQTADGGYIIAGLTCSYGAGEEDVWLIKTDSNGNKQWDKTFGGTYRDESYSVSQTTDGGYIIAGGRYSYRDGFGDVWLIKTDSNGIMQWDKKFGGTYSDYARSVQQTTDGGYILAGSTDPTNSNVEVYLIKTDSSGIATWTKNFGGPYTDRGNSVQQTSDGGYIVTGETQSYGSGDLDVWLIKTNANGNMQWDKTFGIDRHDEGLSVSQTTDGGYIVAGQTYSYGAGKSDVWLIKVAPEGEPEPFYFVHITDTHYGYNGWRNRVKNELIPRINQLESEIGYEPAFVAITGDLVSFGNGWTLDAMPLFYALYEEESNNYGVLKNDLNDLNGIPYYCCPGNHDHYLFTIPNPFVCYGLGAYNSAFPDMNCPKSIVLPEYDLNLIFLDSGCDSLIACCWNPPRGTGLSNDDINWLEDHIQSSLYKVILMHHPTIFYGECKAGWPTYPCNCDPFCWDIGCIHNNRGTFMDTCDDYDVDLACSGHIHDGKAYYRANDRNHPNGIENYIQPDGDVGYPADTSETIYATTGCVNNFRIIFSNTDNNQLEVCAQFQLPPFAGAKSSYIYVIPTVTGTLTGSFISLHLYDEYGNYVGLNKTGSVELEIENATQYILPDYNHTEEYNYNAGYFIWNHTIESISNILDDKSYTYQITGTSDGMFNFSIDKQLTDGSNSEALYLNISITENSIGELYVNGDSIDFTIYMDDDGDGIVDREIEPTMILSPPDKPTKPSGPTNGKAGVEYTYTTSTTDLNEDQIYYLWDWGDNTYSEWLGPYASGATAEASHKWTEKGNYQIRVKAKDVYDYGSEWSDPLPVTMPKSQQSNNQQNSQGSQQSGQSSGSQQSTSPFFLQILDQLLQNLR